jgi:predicted ATPase/Tfp pilus assembly protein PilF
VTVDLLTFDEAIASGDLLSLEQAVALYQGPLLEGCAEEWVLEERQSREQAYLEALERLATAAQGAGDRDAVIRYLRQAAAADPLQESTQRALMQCLADQGSYAAALSVYRDLRERLHRELTAAPDPETTALFDRLRAEAREKAVTGRRGEGATGREEGADRFAPSPQTRSAESPRRPLAERSERSAATLHLPIPPTPLIGREQEVAAVSELLGRDEVRLITLLGVAGTGKTRLALQVAADIANEFADGVYFVDLAPIREPDLVVSTIAQALGLRETGGQTAAESLKAHLREKRILLVLDNFEQILPAAPQVVDLLMAAPQLRTLVTSRAALRVRGEQEFPVPPLSLPDLKRLPPPEALLRYAAVSLFIERVRAVRPDFAVTNENAAAVAEICHRLNGLPLAIELAAARARIFSPQALLARLENRLQVLKGGPRDLPARQQTLRDAIAWSYDLLAEGEQKLFRRLSVFVGGGTLEAVEAVCGGWGNETGDPIPLSPLEGIASLAEQSLLRLEQRSDGPARFALLETLREYAWDQLVARGEAEAVRRRHAQFFLGAAEAGWEGFEIEHDNYRAALSWSLESGEAETGLRLGGALWWFWWNQGHWAEGLERLEQLLALPAASGRTAVRARALEAAGWQAKSLGREEVARAVTEEALSIWRELGDRVGIAGCLVSLGQLHHVREEYDTAQALYEEALATTREGGDRDASLEGWEAHSLSNLGNLAAWRGDVAHAEQVHRESLALSRRLGGISNVAEQLGHLGSLALRRKEYAQAAVLFEESLTTYQQFAHPSKRHVGYSLIGMGKVREIEGRLQTAARLFGAARRIFDEIENRDEGRPDLEGLRAALGEAAFASAWAEGHAMSPEEAVAAALRGEPE